VVTVAHDHPVAALIALADVAGDVVVHLGLQRLGQHPPSALADELVDQRRRATRHPSRISARTSRNYREHGSYLPDRRWRADLA
jgi:hypothetical protein